MAFRLFLTWSILITASPQAVSNPGVPLPAPETDPIPAKCRTDLVAELTASDKRLFLTYDKVGPSRWNPHFDELDLTGVAWDSPRTATAITPRHVVMAAHYARRPGAVLTFHDQTGRKHSRTLLRSISLFPPPTRADIAVGLLDQALPAEIKPYPLLAPSTDNADQLAGGHALVTNQHRQLLVREIQFVGRTNLSFNYVADQPKEARTALIKGDSGNPSFLLLDDGPVLLETHGMGGAGSGSFYSAAKVFAAVSEAVRKLDPTYSLQTVELDAQYGRVATERRLKRPIYQTRQTDGSPIIGNNKRPGTSPPPSSRQREAPVHPPATGGTAPRPRRVPDPPKTESSNSQ